MKSLISFCALFLILISCRNEGENEILYAEPKNLMNISYGPDTKQQFDLWLPANRSTARTKVFVLIHGGGWAGGDRADFAAFVPKIQQNFPDYAVANMNYRLVGSSVNYLLPYLTDDIRSALDLLQERASDYGIKPEFVLCGVSAGGHLSMLYSYKYDEAKRVKAVINIVGPTNFEDNYYTAYPEYWQLINFITAPGSLPAGYTAAQFGSPVTWVTTSSAPTLSFFGSTDELVPPSQKTFLDQKLNEKNVPNESYLLEGGHGIGGEHEAEILAKTKNFIAKYVR